MSSAKQLLDQVQSVARLDALAADPSAYAELVAGELPAGDELDAFEARDHQLRDALGQLDAMIERAARLGIEHALAHDSSIGVPSRKVFATTIVSYAGRLDLLATRARELAARGGASDPDDIATRIFDVARRVLELREAMRSAVLARVQQLAETALIGADGRARDARRDEASRKRWSAVRRDLEMIAQRPEAIAAAPMAKRVAAWPEQLDEPEPEKVPSLAELIELD